MNGTPAPVQVCAVIPVYDHEEAVGTVVDALLAAGLPCILVDDGSGPTCAAVLDRLAATRPDTTLVRRAANGGKGAAVADGLRAALARGYSHAIQVDADGQHDLADLPAFLSACREAPDALACGWPQFDASMPRLRYYSRYLTHVFVWLNTLSFAIRDSMCGFRAYPLVATVAMIEEERPGLRMDFDIEVLVRLYWRGVPMRWIATRVTYPIDGVSHFRLLLDNALITRVHTKLFFGMLWRLPRLLARKVGAQRTRTSHA
jgi:glycosyltransferase involved in cell wall biosynthesis